MRFFRLEVIGLPALNQVIKECLAEVRPFSIKPEPKGKFELVARGAKPLKCYRALAGTYLEERPSSERLHPFANELLYTGRNPNTLIKRLLAFPGGFAYTGPRGDGFGFTVSEATDHAMGKVPNVLRIV